MRQVKHSIPMIALICLMVVPFAPLTVEAADSGFLQDYSQLKPDPTAPGTRRYVPKERSLGHYDKFIIAPIEVWYAPNTKYKGITPDELKAITDNVRAAIVEALEPDYPVVTKAGRGVAAINIAITNVNIQKKKRGLLGYTPAGFVVTSAMNAAGIRTSLVDARLEFEAFDPQTGGLIGLMVSRYPGEKKDKVSWEQVTELSKWYAERFRSRLDAAHAAKKAQ